MNAPAPLFGGAMKQVGIGLWLEGEATLHGSPAVLARICKAFGFANPCKAGRVTLTASKAARLPLAISAIGMGLTQTHQEGV